MIQWTIPVEISNQYNINIISIDLLISVSSKENLSDYCKQTDVKFWKASVWNFYIDIVIAYNLFYNLFYIYISSVLCLLCVRVLSTIAECLYQ